jgi:hypothetical protein
MRWAGYGSYALKARPGCTEAKNMAPLSPSLTCFRRDNMMNHLKKFATAGLDAAGPGPAAHAG